MEKMKPGLGVDTGRWIVGGNADLGHAVAFVDLAAGQRIELLLQPAGTLSPPERTSLSELKSSAVVPGSRTRWSKVAGSIVITVGRVARISGPSSA
jgi:hypothetical protein